MAATVAAMGRSYRNRIAAMGRSYRNRIAAMGRSYLIFALVMDRR